MSHAGMMGKRVLVTGAGTGIGRRAGFSTSGAPGVVISMQSNSAGSVGGCAVMGLWLDRDREEGRVTN